MPPSPATQRGSLHGSVEFNVSSEKLVEPLPVAWKAARPSGED
jgi:hypothetical protein